MKLDWLAIVGIVGTIASIIGLIYAWIVSRRSTRKKILTYKTSFSLALASIIPDRTEHRLTIIYERDGAEPVNVKGAYLWLVTLGNLGREPIKREDIAPSDPLRIEVRNAKVLDIAKAGISREGINFNLRPFEESADGITLSTISFDFLDYNDAAGIRVLTDNSEAQINVAGTIIGMPEGIKPQDELGTLARFPFMKRHLNVFLFVFWIVIYFSTAFGIGILIGDFMNIDPEVPPLLILFGAVIFSMLLPQFVYLLIRFTVARPARLPENLPSPK